MPLFGTVHFHLDKQRAFIQGHGQQVVVCPVVQCPCLLADRQFDPTCATCHGTGRFYPPSSQYATTLLMHQEDSHRIFEEAGTYTHGSIRATVLDSVRLCERDKVIAIESKDTYNDEVLTRGIDDTVRFTHGVSLLYVGDRTRTYRPGIDYTLAPPASVAWLPTGLQPAFGHLYAVKYEACAEYLVVNDSPRLRVEYHRGQSQEVVLLRWDRLSEEVL